uniref:Uncharacterized protein n=1 Tax=Magallana gigas TaxID=29159 RepID=A0A8W8IER7_MAGGI
MRQSLEPDDASNLITCKSDVNTYPSEVEPVPEATSGQSIVDRFERFSQWSRLSDAVSNVALLWFATVFLPSSRINRYLKYDWLAICILEAE